MTHRTKVRRAAGAVPILLVLGVIATLSGLMLFSGEPPPPSGSDATEIADATSTSSESDATGTLAPTDASASRTEVAAPTSDDGTTKKPAAKPRKRRALAVRVVDADAAPVVGATVLWIPGGQHLVPANLQPWMRSNAELIAAADEHGNRNTSDANGDAAMQAERVNGFVIAFDDEHGFGVEYASTDALDANIPLVVTLYRGGTATVAVRHHDGEPAKGIAILALAKSTDDPAQRYRMSTALGTTDDAGRIAVPRIGYLARHVRAGSPYQRAHAGPPRDGPPFELVPQILGLDDVRFAIDPSTPPSIEPPIWRLPPIGTIELVGPDDVDLGPTRGHLQRVVPSASRNDPQLVPAMRNVSWNDKPLPHEVPVALGIRVRGSAASTAPGAAQNRQWMVDGIGPTTPGQRLRMTFTRPSTQYVTGRVVDANGKPSNAHWVGILGSIPGTTPGRSLQQTFHLTGQLTDGRFALPFSGQGGDRDANANREPPQATLTVHFHGQEVASASLGTVVLPRSGDLDLGDVMALPLPCVIRGVVRRDGEPLQGNPLSVHTYDDARKQWRHWLQVGSAEDGTFEFFGRDPKRRLRLVVEGSAFQPIDPIEFTFGAKDVAIDLHVGAELRVLLVLPLPSSGPPTHGGQPLAAPTPIVTITPLPQAGDGASRTPRGGQWTTLGAGWLVGHQQNGLTLGTYRIDVRSPLVADPLHTETVDLTRLGDGPDDVHVVRVDLREALATIRLHVEYEGGPPPANARARVVAGPNEAFGTNVERSPVMLLVPRGGVDVAVHAPFGRQIVRLPMLREDTTVRLASIAVHPFEFVLPASSQIPQTVRASISVQATTGSLQRQATFGRSGRAQVQLAGGASYRVTVSLRGPGGSSQAVPMPAEIDIGAGAPDGPIQLRFDAGVLEAAIQQAAIKKS